MRKLGLVSFILAYTTIAVGAADFPDHPIRFIVPQAAGSATDTVARILAAELSNPVLNRLRVQQDRAKLLI